MKLNIVFIFVTKHHVMELGRGDNIYCRYVSGLYGRDWSALCSGQFTPQGKSSHCQLDRQLG
jgi:hypothetical protein